MQTPAVNSTSPAQVTTGAPVDPKKPVAGQPVDGSTLTTASLSQEKGIFEMVSDTVVGAYTYVKEKVVALFSYVRSLFCGVSDEVKAEQLTALTEKKALVEKTRVEFLKKREEGPRALASFWKAAFEALPKDLQDALIKEDIRDIKKAKFREEAELANEVEKAFNNAVYRNERLSFIRDLKDANFVDSNQMPAGSYNASNDEYIPSYLQHIASQLKQDISALN